MAEHVFDPARNAGFRRDEDVFRRETFIPSGGHDGYKSKRRRTMFVRACRTIRIVVRAEIEVQRFLVRRNADTHYTGGAVSALRTLGRSAETLRCPDALTWSGSPRIFSRHQQSKGARHNEGKTSAGTVIDAVCLPPRSSFCTCRSMTSPPHTGHCSNGVMV